MPSIIGYVGRPCSRGQARGEDESDVEAHAKRIVTNYLGWLGPYGIML
jgi:hypothetical protein